MFKATLRTKGKWFIDKKQLSRSYVYVYTYIRSTEHMYMYVVFILCMSVGLLPVCDVSSGFECVPDLVSHL